MDCAQIIIMNGLGADKTTFGQTVSGQQKGTSDEYFKLNFRFRQAFKDGWKVSLCLLLACRHLTGQ